MFLRMNSGFREWVEVVWDRVAKEWLSEWVNVFGSSGGRVNQCEVVYVSRIDARIQSEWSYGWKDFFMKKKKKDVWMNGRVSEWLINPDSVISRLEVSQQVLFLFYIEGFCQPRRCSETRRTAVPQAGSWRGKMPQVRPTCEHKTVTTPLW